MTVSSTRRALRGEWLLPLLLLAACTGPLGGQRAAEPEEPERLPEPAVDMAAYEDFDPAPYRELAPVAAVEVEHDVPERLMEGRAAAGVTRTVNGFRIQIFASTDKAAAQEAMTQAIAWWNATRKDAPEDLFPDQLPVYVEYGQPYYRVRVGNFVSRAEAEEALLLITERFNGAFILPTLVTVTVE